MKRWVKVGVSVACGAAASAVAAAAVGSARWDRATARAGGRLGGRAAAGDGGAPRTFSREQLAGLPAPVVRYFEFALAPGQPLIRRAHARWEGDFLTKPAGAWNPFTAEQHFAVRPPGFVWDAAIRIAPLLAVRVRDSYLDGEGQMRGRVAGLVPVVDQRGTPEMASSSLARYLGEAVWFPTALLPSEVPGGGVSWSAIDDSTARATLTDRGTTVWMDFHFGEGGAIVGATTERYRDVNGTGVLTPFAGHYRDYARRAGMMVPTAGEVEWLLPEGRFPYWRARLVDVKYE